MFCAQKKGDRNFQKKIVYGDPAQEILKTIESEKIDMVVMGTHGRKGLEASTGDDFAAD